MKLFLTLAFLLGFSSLHAETLTQLRNRVNQKLTNMVPTLVARQNTYASSHGGRYWQGLLTFSSLPAHTDSTTADKLADRLTARPTDQAGSWSTVFPEWNTELFAAGAKIDVYDGPVGVGKGWWIVVYVKHNNIIYHRCKSFGPDKSRDHDWMVLEESD